MLYIFILIMFSPLILMVLGGLTGIYLEYLHKKSIVKREKLYQDIEVTNLKKPPFACEDSFLCSANVTVASDYLKLFFASLRNIVGGRVRSYEMLLERARREALLRIKEEARAKNADFIINVRLQTSTIGKSSGNNANPMVEVIAYGTALIRSK